jgi:hypothetical protein
VALKLHLYDSIDKDKVVFQRDPVLGNRLIQPRHTQVRHIGLKKTGLILYMSSVIVASKSNQQKKLKKLVFCWHPEGQ